MPKKREFKPIQTQFAIQDFFEEFIEEKELSGISPATVKSYRKSFDKFIEFLGDKTALEEIDKSTILAYIRDMRESEISDNSINHYIRDIRVYLNYLMELEYLEPFDIKQIKTQEAEIETYTKDEMETLLIKPKNGASYAEWRSWCVINWIYGTGNRASSILNIKIGDVDLEGKRCKLRHTKSKKAQFIPLSTATCAAVKTYLDMWLYDATDDDYLFQSYTLNHPQLTYNALRLSIAKYNADRGINKTSIHAFRHSFAREYILNGGNAFELQKLLGHSTLEMTKHYVQLYDTDLQRTIDEHNPLDKAKPKPASRVSAHSKKKARY